MVRTIGSLLVIGASFLALFSCASTYQREFGTTYTIVERNPTPAPSDAAPSMAPKAKEFVTIISANDVVVGLTDFSDFMKPGVPYRVELSDASKLFVSRVGADGNRKVPSMNDGVGQALFGVLGSIIQEAASSASKTEWAKTATVWELGKLTKDKIYVVSQKDGLPESSIDWLQIQEVSYLDEFRWVKETFTAVAINRSIATWKTNVVVALAGPNIELKSLPELKDLKTIKLGLSDVRDGFIDATRPDILVAIVDSGEVVEVNLATGAIVAVGSAGPGVRDLYQLQNGLYLVVKNEAIVVFDPVSKTVKSTTAIPANSLQSVSRFDGRFILGSNEATLVKTADGKQLMNLPTTVLYLTAGFLPDGKIFGLNGGPSDGFKLYDSNTGNMVKRFPGSLDFLPPPNLGYLGTDLTGQRFIMQVPGTIMDPYSTYYFYESADNQLAKSRSLPFIGDIYGATSVLRMAGYGLVRVKFHIDPQTNLFWFSGYGGYFNAQTATFTGILKPIVDPKPAVESPVVAGSAPATAAP